ncbi:MAG TPA: class I SAM-dependent methyltransferase [Planctomycetaceae bacterium]|jgi:SAM-dependent methyltransferase|nr:class I SAM-dependent methyltransferase [Planctomycetaceae bacterium]
MNSSGDNWFESDAFWTRLFPIMFTDAQFTAAAENVSKIVALSGISDGSVLDLACGPGRYAVPFAKAGFQVTGVDRTRFLLDKARERATREGATIEWVEQDMRQFSRPAAFDLALNVYTSFGYFDGAAENRRVLENILTSLKPGGAFVFEHLGKEILAGKFQPAQVDTFPDSTMLFQRRTVVEDWSKINAEWILLEGERVTRFHLRHWIYSGREFRDLLTSVGFANISLYGFWDGSPYGPQAQRLIAVARRPS